MISFVHTVVLISIETSLVIILLMLIENSRKIHISFTNLKILWCFIGIRLLLPTRFSIINPVVPLKKDYLQQIIMESTYGTEVTANVFESLTLPDVIIILWLIGVMASLAKIIIANILTCKRFVRWSCRITDSKHLSIYSAVGKQLKIKKLPILLQSNYITTPLLLGIFKTAVVLPNCPYSDEQIHLILMHELTHYKQKDLWGKLLMVLATSIHWFNPLVHIAAMRYDNNLEKSCDEIVLKTAGAAEKNKYANIILSVIMNGQHSRSSTLATYFYSDKKSILKRFEAILSNQNRTHILTMPAVLFMLIVMALSSCIMGWKEIPNIDSSSYYKEIKAKITAVENEPNNQAYSGLMINGDNIYLKGE